MKTIQSAGGPLIALPSAFLPSWGGIATAKFSANSSDFQNDYEAAGFLTTGVHSPACEIAVIQGISATGLLLSSPLETCILDSSPTLVHLAQVHYADEAWSFADIDLESNHNAVIDECLWFEAVEGMYTLFDSACEGDDALEGNYLDFRLESGIYKFSSVPLKSGDNFAVVLVISKEKKV